MSRRYIARDNARGRSVVPRFPAKWQNFDEYPIITPTAQFFEGAVAHPMSTSMTVSALVYHAEALGTHNTQVPVAIGSSAGGFGFIGVRGYNANMYASITTSAGFYNAVHTIPVGTIGAYVLYHAVWDGVNITLYRQGVSVASTATAGTNIASNNGNAIGGMGGGDTCYAMDVVGAGFAESAVISSPSDHYSACVAANDYVSFANEENGYRASDYAGWTSSIEPMQGSGITLPATQYPSSQRWSQISRIVWAP